jgi:hypothetical protein
MYFGKPRNSGASEPSRIAFLVVRLFLFSIWFHSEAADQHDDSHNGINDRPRTPFKMNWGDRVEKNCRGGE